MKYIARKPCRFGGVSYAIGDAIPGYAVEPDAARRLTGYGLIAEVPEAMADTGGAELKGEGGSGAGETGGPDTEIGEPDTETDGPDTETGGADTKSESGVPDTGLPSPAAPKSRRKPKASDAG